MAFRTVKSFEDPFALLSLIYSEQDFVMEKSRIGLDRKVRVRYPEGRTRTTPHAHYIPDSTPLADYHGQMKDLHHCDAFLGFYKNLAEHHMNVVSFLLEHNFLRSLCQHSKEDGVRKIMAFRTHWL
jgi:hypothetical protein